MMTIIAIIALLWGAFMSAGFWIGLPGQIWRIIPEGLGRIPWLVLACGFYYLVGWMPLAWSWGYLFGGAS